MRRRFVLVDPSFDQKAGDKWQYAVSFYDSAIANGYEFVLLAHKNSPSIQPAVQGDVDQRNIFDHAFYEHDLIVSRHLREGRTSELLLQDSACNTELVRMNEVITALTASQKFVQAQRLTRKRDELLARHLRLTECFEPSSAPDSVTPFNKDTFAQAFAAEIDSLDLKQGDIVFVHTATQGMLESLSELKVCLGGSRIIDVDAYFLFHFGVSAPDARTFVDRYYSYSHMSSLGPRLRSGNPFRSLYLVATNDGLRQELEGQIGLRVGLFDGLTDRGNYLRAIGGDGELARKRSIVSSEARERSVVFGVRLTDLTEQVLTEIGLGVAALEKLGFHPRLRIAFRAQHLGRAAAVSSRLCGDWFAFVPTEENDDYIRFLAELSAMIIPYAPAYYEKRVSAVLHDCAVLGVSAIVPRDTTLAQGREYADIVTYGDRDELSGAMIRQSASLLSDPAKSALRIDAAKLRFASDPISRLISSLHKPSLEGNHPSNVAAVVSPAWGRVGSSHAIDDQIDYLLSRGYFVIHVLVADKPLSLPEAADWLWRLLFENSRSTRANIQRIAYRSDVANGSSSDAAVKDAFNAYLTRIAASTISDPQVERLVHESDLIVVNHVFNSYFARRFNARKYILETHDIQSRHLQRLGLIDPKTGAAASYEALFSSELAEVARFDYVINVSREEHSLIRFANDRSRIVIPYIRDLFERPRFRTVAEWASSVDVDPSYQSVDLFDFTLVGDSHPANVGSAIWFLDRVFVPFLQPMGLTFGVVGRLSDVLFKERGSVAGVFYCGFVDEAHEVKRLGRVSILPDQAGTGISIKTLETLAMGMAFVATRAAFRGILGSVTPEPRLFDSPEEFARRAIKLVTDSGERQSVEVESRVMYESLTGKRRYAEEWDEVLRILGSAGGGENVPPRATEASRSGQRWV